MAHGSTLPSHHRSVLFFHVEEEDSDDEVDVDDVDSWLLVVPVLLLAVSFLGPDDEDELRRPLDEIIILMAEVKLKSCGDVLLLLLLLPVHLPDSSSSRRYSK